MQGIFSTLVALWGRLGRRTATDLIPSARMGVAHLRTMACVRAWVCLMTGMVIMGASLAWDHLRTVGARSMIVSGARHDEPSQASNIGRNSPIVVRPTVSRLLEVNAEEYHLIHEQIQPLRNDVASTSYLLHLLRVHGLNGRFNDSQFPSCQVVLQTLTNDKFGQAYWGNAAIARVSSGWRFPTGGSEGVRRDLSLELHRDHTLAALAELGLPLTHPLHSQFGTGTLADVLADSLTNFHLAQQELAWTALAYALYLPPTNSWRNRFGETYSFDNLAMALIERPLDDESCGGTHLLYSLTILARVDEQAPVLSRTVRRQLREHLVRATNVVLATQQADGSWHAAWNYALLPQGEPSQWSDMDVDVSRIVMTGHIAEWLTYLPKDMQVAPATLQRAGLWLKKKVMEDSLEAKETHFCPYTHAVCVLREICFVASEDGTSLASATDE